MPTFSYKGVECVSAGVVFYRLTQNGTIQLLMQRKFDKRSNPFWEDLGGKSNLGDKTIEDVAAREAAEETNAEIQPFEVPEYMPYKTRLETSTNYIKNLITKNSFPLIQRKTKYALFLVYLPDINHDRDFGSCEINQEWHIERTVEWVDPSDVFKNIKNVHPRIRHIIKLF